VEEHEHGEACPGPRVVQACRETTGCPVDQQVADHCDLLARQLQVEDLGVMSSSLQHGHRSQRRSAGRRELVEESSGLRMQWHGLAFSGQRE
jgi:hypothetical protein